MSEPDLLWEVSFQRRYIPLISVWCHCCKLKNFLQQVSAFATFGLGHFVLPSISHNVRLLAEVAALAVLPLIYILK